MDLAPLFNQLVPLLSVFLLLSIVIAFFKSAWFKGFLGEFLTKRVMRLSLPKSDYSILSDVTLEIDGGTTQIDHIVFSIYGIFVIEVKNMKGWIYASANSGSWTQRIYKQSYKFQNPLRQNYKHIKALETKLNMPMNVFHSVIVFTGNSTFKTEVPDEVTGLYGLVSRIKSCNEAVFTDLEVKQAISYISQVRLPPSFVTNRIHRQNLGKERGDSKMGKKLLGVVLAISLLVVSGIIVNAAIQSIFTRMGERIVENSAKDNSKQPLPKLAPKPQPTPPANSGTVHATSTYSNEPEGTIKLSNDRRSRLWNEFYQESEECISPSSMKMMVECVDKKKEAKATFDTLYNEGHFN